MLLWLYLFDNVHAASSKHAVVRLRSFSMVTFSICATAEAAELKCVNFSLSVDRSNTHICGGDFPFSSLLATTNNCTQLASLGGLALRFIRYKYPLLGAAGWTLRREFVIPEARMLGLPERGHTLACFLHTHELWLCGMLPATMARRTSRARRGSGTRVRCIDLPHVGQAFPQIQCQGVQTLTISFTDLVGNFSIVFSVFRQFDWKPANF